MPENLTGKDAKSQVASFPSSGGAGAEPVCHWIGDDATGFPLRNKQGVEDHRAIGRQVRALYFHPAPEPGKLPELETDALRKNWRAQIEDDPENCVFHYDHVAMLLRDFDKLLSALQSQPESGESGR